MEGNRVRIYTTMGPFEVELYYKHAPKTCKNFTSLAKSSYYDDSIFHRIVKNVCIQGGDPTGTGLGGTSIYGKFFEDEITRELKHTGAGILCMCNQGKPNTNASQFYITLAPFVTLFSISADNFSRLPKFDGKDTIFGRVSKGIQILKRMSLVKCDKEKPVKPIRIMKMEIVGEEDEE